MATSTFKPTEEQANAVALAEFGGDLAVEALAGAGKTSTLTLIAEALGTRGAYVAFNRKIVDDARAKFPKNVRCSTAHGLAMAVVGRKFSHRIQTSGRITSRRMVELLGLDADTPVVLSAGEETRELEAWEVASAAKKTVDAFCQSADHDLGRKHVPWMRGLDAPNQRANNVELAGIVVPLARKIWADVNNVDGLFKFEHGHYLKMWHLQGPRIHADFILFDEAQDANPIMMDIVEQQAHAQRIWVGDSNQSIYEWNGAVDALGKVDVENRATLSTSFRFGPEIAEQANIVLERLGVDARVTGAGRPGAVEFVERPDVFLGRTNAEVVARALSEMAEGRRVCLQGGSRPIVWFAESALDLMDGRRASHPDLACFRTWDEVLRYVDEDEDGADLRLLVNIILTFGADEIIDQLAGTVDAANADVTVSTAHKSKGAEWDRVALLGDFPVGDRVAPPDLRLMYVAATRARSVLDRTLVDLEGRE